MKRKQLTNYELVKAYMETASYDELVERLGRSKSSIQSRVYILRKAGVKLPSKLNRKRRIDVEELNDLIANYNPQTYIKATPTRKTSRLSFHK